MIELGVVPLGLLFAYSNGRNDSSAIVSTVLAVGAVEPKKARLLGALFEFLGAAFLGHTIVYTLSRKVVMPENISAPTLGIIAMAALCGAITWNYLNLKLGLPSSSSHALIGGMVGATLISGYVRAIHWGTLKIIAVWLIAAPVISFFVAAVLLRLTVFALRNGTPALNIFFKKLALPFSLLTALFHGTNDGQKALGMIAFGLTIYPSMDTFYPLQLLCAAALAMGIAVGGWKTTTHLGRSLYKIRPVHGFSAQVPAIIALCSASSNGIPVSGTHILSSTIVGAGAAFWPKRLRWPLVGEIFTSWLCTIPGSGMLAVFWFLIISWLNTYL